MFWGNGCDMCEDALGKERVSLAKCAARLDRPYPLARRRRAAALPLPFVASLAVVPLGLNLLRFAVCSKEKRVNQLLAKGKPSPQRPEQTYAKSSLSSSLEDSTSSLNFSSMRSRTKFSTSKL